MVLIILFKTLTFSLRSIPTLGLADRGVEV